MNEFNSEQLAEITKMMAEMPQAPLVIMGDVKQVNHQCAGVAYHDHAGGPTDAARAVTKEEVLPKLNETQRELVDKEFSIFIRREEHRWTIANQLTGGHTSTTLKTTLGALCFAPYGLKREVVCSKDFLEMVSKFVGIPCEKTQIDNLRKTVGGYIDQQEAATRAPHSFKK